MCGLLSPVMVGQGELGIDPAGLVVPLAGRLVATGDRWEPYRLVDEDGVAVDCCRGVLRAPAGGGAGGADRPLVWHGLAALVPVPVGGGGGLGSGDPVRWPGFLPVAAAGRQAGAAALARAGPDRAAARPRLRARCMRRRCVRIARRCCAAFMTSTGRRARARWSIRSRWTGRAGAGARMRTTIRWSPTIPSAAACTGRRCRPGSRAASRMRSSTRSSRPCVRTGTGPWSRSMCRPARGRRSCCRRPAAARTRDGS